ncbi:B-cell receptor CD22-like [Salvelinus alpinus]|uniref:B-cell receptor CD22-like n=1 Tax=Salvelinus alpinus TaxID=8036 RepID=UPI0039FDA1C5
MEPQTEGLQVKVTGGHQDKTLTCITTCTLTDKPTYIWSKNGHKVKEDPSSLYSDSFSDADNYSCAVKGHENLPAPAVCKKCWRVTYTHQSICTLKGSTVDISCSYTYPSYHDIKQAFWFTKWSGMDTEDLSSVPGYEGHIEYLGDKKSDCTLRITDLRLSDSAGYRFRFITSGDRFSGSPVSLTVTDVVLEMDPTSVSEGENVTLTCRTNCTLDPITAYSWYKNGQPIPNSNTYSPVYILFTVSSEDTGRYSCAVEGHEDLPSAEVTLTVRYGPKNTSVSVSPSGEIVEGSSVTLTCSSDSNPPVDKYTWYKNNAGHYQSISNQNTGPQHVFNHIKSSDTGEYYCEARNEIQTGRSESINMDVKLVLGQDGWSVTYTPQSICTLKGSTVDLSCSYTYPSGTVTTTFWFTELGTGKEPEDLGQDPEYAGRLEYHGDKKNGQRLKITDLRESDSAEYKFRLLTDHEGGKYIGSPGVTLSVTGTVTFKAKLLNSI